MAEMQSMQYPGAPFVYPVGASKPDYSALVDYMETVLGGRRRQITLDENYTKIVTLSSLASGGTGPVIDVRVPAGQKFTICGTQSVPRGADARTAHALRMRLADTGDTELRFDTKVRATKEGITDDVDNLWRVFYGDLSITKTPGGMTATTTMLKTDLEWYRYKQTVIFDGEEHEIFTVIAADRAVDSAHIKFAQDIDVWYF